MPTPLKWADLTAVQQQLLYAMETRLRRELVYKLAVRDMYLQPDLFAVYEEIVKRQYNEDEIAAGSGDYTFMKVHVKKGSMLQREPFELNYWATSLRDREKQREELNMNALN